MENKVADRIRELIQQGEKLAPQGGLEFSGYNAKLQGQYLLWRKSCLDALGKLGEPGLTLRAQITADENGAYFYQNSAQVVLNALKATQSIIMTSEPEPDPPAPPAPEPAQAPEVPEIPAAQAPPPALRQAPGSNTVLVSAVESDQLLHPLLDFLKEIGIESLLFSRTAGGKPSIVDQMNQATSVQYAFVLFRPDDIQTTMFEIGYLAGKLGAERVCCIHAKDVTPPQDLPGINVKEVVVKFEEIGFALIKELKSAGYTVQL